MREATPAQQQQAARVLIAALAHVPTAWKDFASASAEVATFVDDPERFAMLAVDRAAVRGWIGAIQHSQFGWELHPLAVAPEHQRQGIGTQLVKALEAKARLEGVLTVWLGTDDDFGGTNLYGRDLYPDVLGTLQTLRVTSGHPYRFYEKLGYTVTGVFPDVDGIGKHDILMAKRIAV
ncbi:MAG TPA: GNAT family N-acetyltransferase [Longimicrobiales bacterium]